MIDFEVMPELMSGTKVEKERKNRLEVSLSFLSLAKSRNFNKSSLLRFSLVLSRSWPVAVCDVVCRRLVHPSRSRAPLSFERAIVFRNFSRVRPFSLQRKPPTSI